MNEKKKLLVSLLALVVVLGAAAVFYNSWKDRVDPTTGKTAQSASAEASAESAALEAPDFTMQDAAGTDVLLSDFEGKPVVLNFWTSWCGYCKQEMPDFEEAYQTYGEDVQFIMLNSVTGERNAQDGVNYMASQDFTFPVYYDSYGEGVNTYGLRGYPATVVVDAEGYVTYARSGMMSGEDLVAEIEAVLGE